MPSGTFISFEGPDGSGKTTLLKRVDKTLEDQMGASSVLVTREPGGDPLAEKIRDLLFDDQFAGMDGRTEALLFAAARRQHLIQDVNPALEAGKVVLCDRFVDSSVAYQGAGRGIGEKDVWDLNQFAIHGELPQLTIYLDLPVEVGIERIKKHRQNQVNRLDREQLAFHRTVRQGYLHLAKLYPSRIAKIDATQTADQVYQQTMSVINQRFPQLQVQNH